MKVRIEFTYETPKGTQAGFASDDMYAGQAMLIGEDLEKTGRSKSVTFIDQHEATWTLKELKAYMKGIQTEPHNISVYFDGGFDRASKKAGLGCVIYYEQNGKAWRLRKNAFVDELDTNNEAEYAALHLALQELELLQVNRLPVTFTGDSQVVINQLTGEWPCLEEELSKWADRIEAKVEQLGIDPEYELVSRKSNQEADRLASQALNEIEITSTREMEAGM